MQSRAGRGFSLYLSYILKNSKIYNLPKNINKDVLIIKYILTYIYMKKTILTEFFKKNLFFISCAVLFGCSKEGEGNNTSDGFLDNNFIDKTIVVAGSTINDGSVILINNKKV